MLFCFQSVQRACVVMVPLVLLRRLKKEDTSVYVVGNGQAQTVKQVRTTNTIQHKLCTKETFTFYIVFCSVLFHTFTWCIASKHIV